MASFNLKWTAADDSENSFLEDVFGERALEFVGERNKAALGVLGDPKESPYYEKVLAILNSKDKVCKSLKFCSETQ
jgi:hypothetical protein